jgi:hypothetical protein
VLASPSQCTRTYFECFLMGALACFAQQRREPAHGWFPRLSTHSGHTKPMVEFLPSLEARTSFGHQSMQKYAARGRLNATKGRPVLGHMMQE